MPSYWMRHDRHNIRTPAIQIRWKRAKNERQKERKGRKEEIWRKKIHGGQYHEYWFHSIIRACYGPTLVGRPITFLYDGPGSGPARQFLRGWAAARPDPSIFQRIGRGPAQPITLSNIYGPARPIIFSKVSARPGPARLIIWQRGPWDPDSVLAGTIITRAGPCVVPF